MSDIRFYDETAVCARLDLPGCIGAVRAAMADFSAAGKSMPLRQIVAVGEGGMFASMPGTLSATSGFGAKLVSVFPDPAAGGRSRHQGVVVLFDPATGAPQAIANAEAITTLRTAAASAVATDALARRDARRLAIFGCGTQSAPHIRAIRCVRPIEQVTIWGRSLDKAQALAREIAAETGLAVDASSDAEAVAADADIICTVTGSATPVLLGAWVKPGTHVNLVGSSHAGPVEVDHALVLKGRYIADSRASVIAAGAEFLLAKAAGLIGDDHIAAEIGEVLLDPRLGRQRDDEITLYKSLGHVVQDLAAIRYVHGQRDALEAG